MAHAYRILSVICLMLMIACTSRNSQSSVELSERDSVTVSDALLTDTLHHPSPEEFLDNQTPPPPPPDGKHFDGPPPHGKDRPPHKPDNMRGFDPASEDDMEDNGMSRYMENNDEEGWN